VAPKVHFSPDSANHRRIAVFRRAFISGLIIFSVNSGQAQVRHDQDAVGPGTVSSVPIDCTLSFDIDPRYAKSVSLTPFLDRLADKEVEARNEFVKTVNSLEALQERIKYFSDFDFDREKYLKALLQTSYGLHRLYEAQTLHTQTEKKIQTTNDPTTGAKVEREVIIPSALANKMAELREKVEAEIAKEFTGKKFLVQTEWKGHPDRRVIDWSRVFVMPDASRDLLPLLFEKSDVSSKVPWRDPDSLRKWELLAGEKSSLSLLDRFSRFFRGGGIGDAKLEQINWIQAAAMRENILNAMEFGTRKRIQEETEKYPSLRNAFVEKSDKEWANAILEERRRWCRFFSPQVIPTDLALMRLQEEANAAHARLREKLENEKKTPDEVQAALAKLEDRKTPWQKDLETLTRMKGFDDFASDHHAGRGHGLPLEVRARLEALSPTARQMLSRMALAAVDKTDRANVMRALFEANEAMLTEPDTKKRAAYMYPPGSEQFFARVTKRDKDFLHGLASLLSKDARTGWNVEECDNSLGMYESLGNNRFMQAYVLPQRLAGGIDPWKKVSAEDRDKLFENVFRELHPARADELEQACGGTLQTPEGKKKGLFLMEENMFFRRPLYLVAYYQYIGLYLGWKATPEQIAKDILENFPDYKLPELNKFRKDYAREGSRFLGITKTLTKLGEFPSLATPDRAALLESHRTNLADVPNENFQLTLDTLQATLEATPDLIGALKVGKDSVPPGSISLDATKAEGLGRLIVPQVSREHLPPPPKVLPPLGPPATGPPAEKPPVVPAPPAEKPAPPPDPLANLTALAKKQLEANQRNLAQLREDLQNPSGKFHRRDLLAKYFDTALKTQTGKTLKDHFPALYKADLLGQPPSVDEIALVRRLVEHVQASERERAGGGDLPENSKKIDDLMKRLLSSQTPFGSRTDLQEELIRLRGELQKVDSMRFAITLDVVEASLFTTPDLVFAMETVNGNLTLNPEKMRALAYFQIPLEEPEDELKNKLKAGNSVVFGPAPTPGVLFGSQADLKQRLTERAAFFIGENDKIAKYFLDQVTKKQGKFAGNDKLIPFFDESYQAAAGHSLSKVGSAERVRDAIIHQLFLDGFDNRNLDFKAVSIVELRAEKGPANPEADEDEDEEKFLGIIKRSTVAKVADFFGGLAKKVDPLVALHGKAQRLRNSAMAMSQIRDHGDMEVMRAVARSVLREGEEHQQDAWAFEQTRPDPNDPKAQEEHEQKRVLYAAGLENYEQARELGSHFGYGLRAGEDTRSFYADKVSLTINGYPIHGVPISWLKDPIYSQDLYWNKIREDSPSCESLPESDPVRKICLDLIPSVRGGGATSWIDRVKGLPPNDLDKVVGHFRQKYRHLLDKGFFEPNTGACTHPDFKFCQLRAFLRNRYRIPLTAESSAVWKAAGQPGPTCERMAEVGQMTEEEKTICLGPKIPAGGGGGGRGPSALAQWKSQLVALHKKDPRKFGLVVRHYRMQFNQDPAKEKDNPKQQWLQAALGEIYGSSSAAAQVIVEIKEPTGNRGFPAFPGRIARLEASPFAEQFRAKKHLLDAEIITQKWITDPVRPGETEMTDEQVWKRLEAAIDKRKAEVDLVIKNATNYQNWIKDGNEEAVKRDLLRRIDSGLEVEARHMRDLRSYAHYLPQTSPFRRLIFKLMAPPHLSDLMDPAIYPNDSARFKKLVDSLPSQLLAEEWLLYDSGVLPHGLQVRGPGSSRQLLQRKDIEELHQRLDLKRKAFNGRTSNGAPDPGAEVTIPANSFHANREILYDNVGDHGDWVTGLVNTYVAPAVKNRDFERMIRSLQVNLAEFQKSLPRKKDESDAIYDARYARKMVEAMGFFWDQYCVVTQELSDPSKKAIPELWPIVQRTLPDAPNPSKEHLTLLQRSLMNVILVLDGELASRRRQLTDGAPEGEITQGVIDKICGRILTKRTSLAAGGNAYQIASVKDDLQAVYKKSLKRFMDAESALARGDSRWLGLRKSWESEDDTLSVFYSWTDYRVNPHLRILATEPDSWTVNRSKMAATMAAIRRRQAHLKAGGKVGERSANEPSDSKEDLTLRRLEESEAVYRSLEHPEHVQSSRTANHFLRTSADNYKLPYGSISFPTLAATMDLPTPVHDALFFLADIDTNNPAAYAERQYPSPNPDTWKSFYEIPKAKELHRKIAQTLLSPHPDAVLDTLLGEPRIRDAYARSLDAALFVRYEWLLDNRKRNPAEEVEFRMLQWILNCEAEATVPPRTTRLPIGKEKQEDRFAGWGRDGQPPFARGCSAVYRQGGYLPSWASKVNVNAPTFGDVYARIPLMTLAEKEQVRGWASRQLRLYLTAKGVDLSKEKDLVEAAKKTMAKGGRFNRDREPKDKEVLSQVLVSLLWALDGHDEARRKEPKGSQLVSRQAKGSADPDFEVSFDPAVAAAREHRLDQQAAVFKADEAPRKFLDELLAFRYEDGGGHGSISPAARARILALSPSAREKLAFLKKKLAVGNEADRRLLHTVIETADPDFINNVVSQKIPAVGAHYDRLDMDPAQLRRELVTYFADKPGEFDTKPDQKMAEKFQLLFKHIFMSEHLLPYLDAVGRGMPKSSKISGAPDDKLVRAQLLAEIRDAAAKEYILRLAKNRVLNATSGETTKFEKTFDPPLSEWMGVPEKALPHLAHVRKLLANPALFMTDREIAAQWTAYKQMPTENASAIQHLEEVEKLRAEQPQLWEQLKALAKIQGIANVDFLDHAGSPSPIPGEGAAIARSQRLVDRIRSAEHAAEFELVREYQVALSDRKDYGRIPPTEQANENLYRLWDEMQKQREEIIQQLLSGKVTLQDAKKCEIVKTSKSLQQEEFEKRYRMAAYDRDLLRSRLSVELQSAIGDLRRLQTNLHQGLEPVFAHALHEEQRWMKIEMEKLRREIKAAEIRIETTRAELAKQLPPDKAVNEQWNAEYMQQRAAELARRDKELACLFKVAFGKDRDDMLDLKKNEIVALGKKLIHSQNPKWTDDQVEEEFERIQLSGDPEAILNGLVRAELYSANPDLKLLAAAALALQPASAQTGSGAGLKKSELIELFSGFLVPPGFDENTDSFSLRLAKVDEAQAYFDERDRLKDLFQAARQAEPHLFPYNDGSNTGSWHKAKLIAAEPTLNPQGPADKVARISQAMLKKVAEHEAKRKLSVRSSGSAFLPMEVTRKDGHLDFSASKFGGKTEQQIRAALDVYDPSMRHEGQAVEIPITPWEELKGKLAELYFRANPREGKPSIFQFNDHTVVKAFYHRDIGDYSFTFHDAAEYKKKGTQLVQDIQKKLFEMKECFADLSMYESTFTEQVRKIWGGGHSEPTKIKCVKLEDEVKPMLQRLEDEFGTLHLDSEGKYYQVINGAGANAKLQHTRLPFEWTNPQTGVTEDKFKRETTMEENADEGFTYRGYSPAKMLADNFRNQLEHRFILDAHKVNIQIEEDHQAMINQVLITAGVTAASFIFPPLLPAGAYLQAAVHGARLAMAMHWGLHVPMREMTILNGRGTWKVFGDYNAMRGTRQSDLQWEYYRSIALFMIQGAAAAELNALIGAAGVSSTSLAGQEVGAGAWARFTQRMVNLKHQIPHTLVGVGTMHGTDVLLGALDQYRKEGRFPNAKEFGSLNMHAIHSDAYAAGFDRLAAGLSRNMVLRFLTALGANEGLRAVSVYDQYRTQVVAGEDEIKKKEEELRKTDDPTTRRELNNQLADLKEQVGKITYFDTLQNGWVSSFLTHIYFASHAMKPGAENVREDVAMARRFGDGRGEAPAPGKHPIDSWLGWVRRPSGQNKGILNEMKAYEEALGLNERGEKVRPPKADLTEAEMAQAEAEYKQLGEQLEAAAGQHLAGILSVGEMRALEAMSTAEPRTEGSQDFSQLGRPSERRVAESKKAIEQLAKAYGMEPKVFGEALRAHQKNVAGRGVLERINPLGELQTDGTRLVTANRASDVAASALPEILREAQKIATRDLEQITDRESPAFQKALEALAMVENSLQNVEAPQGMGMIQFPSMLHLDLGAKQKSRYVPQGVNAFVAKYPALKHAPFIGSGEVSMQVRGTFKPSWFEKVPLSYFLSNKEAKDKLLPQALHTIAAREGIDPRRFLYFANAIILDKVPGRENMTVEKFAELYKEADRGGVDALMAWYREGRIVNPETIRAVFGEAYYREFLQRLAKERIRDTDKLAELLDVGVDMSLVEQALGFDLSHKSTIEVMGKVSLGSLNRMLVGEAEAPSSPAREATLPEGSKTNSYWLSGLRQEFNLPGEFLEAAVISYIRRLAPNAEERTKSVMYNRAAIINEGIFLMREAAKRLQDPKTKEQKELRDTIARALVANVRNKADVPPLLDLPVGAFIGGRGKTALEMAGRTTGISSDPKAPAGVQNPRLSAHSSEMDLFLHYVENMKAKHPDLPVREVLARFHTERTLGYRSTDQRPKGKVAEPQFDAAVSAFRDQTGFGDRKYGGAASEAEAIFKLAYVDWASGNVAVKTIEDGKEVYRIVQTGNKQVAPSVVTSREAMENYAGYLEELRVEAGFTEEKFEGDVTAARRAFARTYLSYRSGAVRYERESDGRVSRDTRDPQYTLRFERDAKLFDEKKQAAAEMEDVYKHEELLRTMAGFTADSHGSEAQARDAFYRYQSKYYSGESPGGGTVSPAEAAARTREPMPDQARNIWALHAAENRAPAQPPRQTADITHLDYVPGKTKLEPAEAAKLAAFQQATGYTQERLGAGAPAIFDQAVKLWRAGFQVFQTADGSLGLVRKATAPGARSLADGRKFFVEYPLFHEALRGASGFTGDKFGGNEEAARTTYMHYMQKFLGDKAVHATLERTRRTGAITKVAFTEGGTTQNKVHLELLGNNPMKVAEGLRDLYQGEEFLRITNGFVAEKFGNDENVARAKFREYLAKYIQDGKYVSGADARKIVTDGKTSAQRTSGLPHQLSVQPRLLYNLENPGNPLTRINPNAP